MDIKLPRLGEGAESGTVVSILVKAGDQVKEGQTIVELENEKAVAPIPTSASGRVSKLYVKEGDKLSVGQSILALHRGRRRVLHQHRPRNRPANPCMLPAWMWSVISHRTSLLRRRPRFADWPAN